MRSTDDLTCAVCEEEAESILHLAECFTCRRLFHLNPYNNRPGKDCGDAGLGSVEGIETYCADCIDAARRMEAAGSDSDQARVASIVRTVLGEGMQLPQGSSNRPPVPGQRRTFRRVQDE